MHNDSIFVMSNVFVFNSIALVEKFVVILFVFTVLSNDKNEFVKAFEHLNFISLFEVLHTDYAIAI